MPETNTALIEQLVYIDNFLNNGTGDTPQLDVDGQLSLDLAAFADDSFIFPDEDKPKHPHDDGNDDDFNEGRHNNHAKLPTLDGHIPRDLDSNWLSDPHQNASFDFKGKGPSEGRKALANINFRSRDQNSEPSPHFTDGNLTAPEPHSAGHVNGTIQGSHSNFLPTQNQSNMANIPDLSHLPKFPVPPGAESSLRQAGLSHSQIDLLAALIAQHQSALGNPNSSRAAPTQEAKEYLDNDERNAQSVEPPMVLPSPSPILMGQSTSRSGRNLVAIESPESINSNYSSGYNSASLLSTPQLGRRSSTGLTHGGSSHTENDKRKRNTEASARFRVKRKMREKEMENRMKQLDDLIKNFEVKISELEMENRLLKNLIIEKGDQRSTQELKMLKEKAQGR